MLEYHYQEIGWLMPAMMMICSFFLTLIPPLILTSAANDSIRLQATEGYPDVPYGKSDLAVEDVPSVGHYERIQSQTQLHRDFKQLDSLTASDADKVVWIRGRVSNIRAKVGLVNRRS